jgi:hypothetical protein
MIGPEFSDVLVVIVNRKGSGTRGLKCDSKVPEGGSESIHASRQAVPITRTGRVDREVRSVVNADPSGSTFTTGDEARKPAKHSEEFSADFDTPSRAQTARYAP